MAEQKLGKYEVLERLGRGGMAEVYRAYHRNLDRYVAIKVLHSFLAEDDEFRVRFEKEARNIAKLNHAHIVQVYDYDYAPDRDSYYMVMELISGVTLKDRLYDLAEQGERLPLEETLRIIREAASALSYAHGRGMIHRDVKPANLMLDDDDRVVLTDFGIAKMLDAQQLTVSGGMIGTPAYMSPEQGLGEPGDDRSDIYSLGVIMYQLLVGELPYDAETALGVILMHVNDPIPRVRDLNPNVPEAVQYIVNRAMAKTPDQRYPNADELIEDIEKFEHGEPVGTVGTVGKLPFKEENVIRPKSIDTQILPETVQEQSTSESVAVEGKTRGFSMWAVGLIATVIVVFLGYWGGVGAGVFPSFTGAGITTTSTPTESISETPTSADTTEPPVVAVVSTDTPAPMEPSDTPIPPTDTEVPTDVPIVVEVTDTPTDVPTATLPPTATHTASPTPNLTVTAAVIQTATIEACDFDYAIVEQVPADGEEGGFFPVNQTYVREITLLNTGTCAWGENTSLTFVRGEDFNAGPRIFVRESLQVGEEITIVFEGMTPSKGSLDPIVGTWQLRTRGQIPIGDPFDIQVFVFDPGS